jgi:thiosulfate dehydrogenase
MIRLGLALLCALAALACADAAHARPTIEELKSRAVLDDYESNVVFGYNIVMDTHKYAPRYAGGRLSCTSCHLKGGTQPEGFPLNVAGVYPKWRAKNGVRNGLGMRIRDCFLYSLNGLMPPEESPEVLAVSAYVSYLSEGEVIGRPPKNWGVPTLPDTGADPNPARGQAVYKRECAVCHGADGTGSGPIPPVWGLESFNSGSGMAVPARLAGFIWANMPMGKERSLTHQEALDVAAFISIQHRPTDPREGKLRKLAEQIYQGLSRMFGTANSRAEAGAR